MGYQDRDYFRDQPSPYWELIRSTRACWGIVLAVALVYLAAAFTQDSAQPVYDYLKLDPPAMIQGWQWHRLFTAAFVAENPWHLAFALLVIWIIGHELEQMLGGLEMLAFFLFTSVLSNLTITLVSYYATPPPPFGLVTVASFGPAAAAIAMIAWSAMVSPHRVVQYLFVPMPMWVVAVLVIVFDLFFFMQHQPLAVRFALHALTVPFALVYAHYQWRLTGWRLRPGQRSLPARRKQLSSVLQAPTHRQTIRDDLNEAPSTPPAIPRKSVDEQLEAKLDAVLEKVSSQGMASLTEEERNFLKQASEVMKKRKS